MSRSWEDVGLMIKHIQHRNMKMLETHLAPLGISIVQWNALRTIDRYPGICLHRLAVLTFNSDQAAGTLATRMRKLGLVARLPGKGRATVHELTSKGRALLEEGRLLVQEILSRNFAPLSEGERELLAALLRKLLDDDYPVDP